ncbi:MAG: hypothetical protein ACYC7A_10945 [Thermoanaerobaculia bacterium]
MDEREDAAAEGRPDDTAETPPPPPAPPTRRWPADYYAEPLPEGAGTKNAGLILGCGVLSIFALLVIAAGGYWAGHGGAAKLMRFVFTSTEKQVDLIATGVADADRKALKEELRRMGSDIEKQHVAFKDVQAVQQVISRTIRDRKLTPSETAELTAVLRKTPRMTPR